MVTRRRATLIFNPVAGRASEDLARLRQLLEPALELHVLETDRACDADACARKALAEARPDLVIAAGGDGTVSLVGGVLVGSDVPLAIIARGTSNSIAGGLGIPTDLDEAAEVALTGQPRLIDTARAAGRALLLHASIGFHAATVAETPRGAKNRWGVLAYIKEGLARLGDLEPFAAELETESEIIRCRATNITVANVAPLKTVLAQGPAALSPDDGALDVTIVAATGLAEAVATGLHLLRTAAQGEPASRDNVGFFSARRLRITTDPVQPVLVDGEKAGASPLTIDCLPHSLRVLVPPDAVDEPPAPPQQEKLEGLPDLEVEAKPPRRG